MLSSPQVVEGPPKTSDKGSFARIQRSCQHYSQEPPASVLQDQAPALLVSQGCEITPELPQKVKSRTYLPTWLPEAAGQGTFTISSSCPTTSLSASRWVALVEETAVVLYCTPKPGNTLQLLLLLLALLRHLPQLVHLRLHQPPPSLYLLLTHPALLQLLQRQPQRCLCVRLWL